MICRSVFGPLLFGALAVSPCFAESLRVEIVNGSGGPFREAVTIDLLGFGSESGEWGGGDAREGWLFADIPAGEENPYLLQAGYLGVSYSQHITLQSGVDSTITVLVYDTTSRWDKIEVVGVEFDISIASATGNLRVDQILRFHNGMKKTLLGGEDGLIPVALPVTVSDPGRVTLAVSTGLVPLRREAILTDTPKRIAVDYPLRPGITTIAASVDVSYRGQYFYSAVVPYDIPHGFLVVPRGLEISGEGITVQANEDDHQGHLVYHTPRLKKGDELAFLVSGTAAPLEAPMAGDQNGARPPGRITTGEAFLAEMRWLYMGGLTLLLVLGLFFYRAPDPEDKA